MSKSPSRIPANQVIPDTDPPEEAPPPAWADPCGMVPPLYLTGSVVRRAGQFGHAVEEAHAVLAAVADQGALGHVAALGRAEQVHHAVLLGDVEDQPAVQVHGAAHHGQVHQPVQVVVHTIQTLGREREVDTIVLATGFETQKYVSVIDVEGRDLDCEIEAVDNEVEVRVLGGDLLIQGGRDRVRVRHGDYSGFRAQREREEDEGGRDEMGCEAADQRGAVAGRLRDPTIGRAREHLLGRPAGAEQSLMRPPRRPPEDLPGGRATCV